MPSPPTPTTTANNTSIGSGFNSYSINIKQGPEWLVRFYLNPPGWLNPLIKLIGILALLVVVYRLYQSDWKIGLDDQREMQIIASTVIGVITGVLGMVNWTQSPYLIDVSGGFLLGYGSVLAGQYAGRLLSGYETWVVRTGVWLFLAICAFLLPTVVYRGEGLTLGTSRLIVAFICILLVVHNLARERDLRETPDNLSDPAA